MNHVSIQAAGQSGTLLVARAEVDVLIPAEQTDAAFSLLHLRHPPGCWTPPHLHRGEDETVFVLSGALRVVTEDEAIDLLPGQAMTLPRGHPHRTGNPGGEPARLLVLFTPGGLERFVRVAGRPVAEAGKWETSKADLDRLLQQASHHGIALLGSEALALSAPGAAATRKAPETLDVFGVGLEFLAELGPGDDDLSLMRGRLPPHIVVPLHSHADREVLYVLDGTLDISLGPVGEARWQRIGQGGFLDVAHGIPHALRNSSDVPMDILLVATRRIAMLFRELGCPPAEVPPGPPSPARLAAFAQASAARGYWLADAQENAAIGLLVG